MKDSRFDRVRGYLPTFLAGASAGLAVVVWFLYQKGSRHANGAGAVDLEALHRSLGEVSGGEGVRLRDLGGGIIEALGVAPDPEAVQRVLSTLRSAPGVSVVVNRIWTQASAGERPSDLSPASGSAPDATGN